MATISKLTESISKNEQKTKELNQQIDARSKSRKILKVSWGHAKCYRLKCWARNMLVTYFAVFVTKIMN